MQNAVQVLDQKPRVLVVNEDCDIDDDANGKQEFCLPRSAQQAVDTLGDKVVAYCRGNHKRHEERFAPGIEQHARDENDAAPQSLTPLAKQVDEVEGGEEDEEEEDECMGKNMLRICLHEETDEIQLFRTLLLLL